MVDLHCHSRSSDGTETPAAVAELGRGFLAHALTDHDTVAGCAEFLAAGEGCGPHRLAGVELSVDPGEGYGEFHLLGLGVDPAHPALTGFLDAMRVTRERRNAEIIGNFAAMGMEFTLDELLAEAAGGVPTRPHVARILIRRGWVRSMDEAFEKYLGEGKPGNAPRKRPPAGEAIAAVHAAGGAAVMAHPAQWTEDWGKLRAGLGPLKELGLDGIEAYYSANAVNVTVEHVRVAKEFGFLATAGSDFHGENRPGRRLGMEVPDEEGLVKRLLERIGR